VGQVLLNLLNNALKFTPAHGRVQVALVADEREVTVSVRDNGIGIAPEHLPRLFDKFYQVDPSLTRSHGGAGLGLSISKAIVEAHGGRMGVLSEPERGSTFWFSLPMISTRCEEPASRAEPDTAIGQVSDA
jgi:signal transduction histidine kinase